MNDNGITLCLIFAAAIDEEEVLTVQSVVAHIFERAVYDRVSSTLRLIMPHVRAAKDAERQIEEIRNYGMTPSLVSLEIHA